MQESQARVRRVAHSVWTEPRIGYLRQRWSKGASATRIARELGGGISTNAVLAKVRRLGIIAVLPDRRRSQRSNRKGNLVASSHAIPDHLRATRTASPERPVPAWIVDAKPYVDNPGIDADIPRAQRRSFLDLSTHTCRWPVGDPASRDFFFCGAPPLVDKPYCAGHCARAYRAQEEAAAGGSRPRRAVLRNRSGATATKAGNATAARKSWMQKSRMGEGQ
jgi:GcrA cell cycle regulator